MFTEHLGICLYFEISGEPWNGISWPESKFWSKLVVEEVLMCVSCSGSIKPLILSVLPSWWWRQGWGDSVHGTAIATLYLDFEMFWSRESLFLAVVFFVCLFVFLEIAQWSCNFSKTISHLWTALILFIHCTCISVLGTGRRNGIGRKKVHFRDKITPLLSYSCSPGNTNYLLSVSITLDIFRMFRICCCYCF